ncbi:hypothetical protein [Falsiroseomonas oryziterrae]|uniref:hypothetical protein n=1 Tax=Falsiroseomonas oryziterrae TaxID=2911368 RepID=UPI001F287990|nr:hypothetical protein [Roseomonas sp. NPKOSM-4]
MQIHALIPALPDAAMLTVWLVWIVAAVIGLNVVIMLLGQGVRFPLGRVASRGRDLTDRINGLLGGVAIACAAVLGAQLLMRLNG